MESKLIDLLYSFVEAKGKFSASHDIRCQIESYIQQLEQAALREGFEAAREKVPPPPRPHHDCNCMHCDRRDSGLFGPGTNYILDRMNAPLRWTTFESYEASLGKSK